MGLCYNVHTERISDFFELHKTRTEKNARSKMGLCFALLSIGEVR